MPYRVHITPRAEADIDEALAWYAERSLVAAARWHGQLLAAVKHLEEPPLRYPVAPETADFGIELRELIFGKRRGVYRILFSVEEDVVHVLHVRHAARDRVKPEDIDL